jgi:hypothetical protein
MAQSTPRTGSEKLSPTTNNIQPSRSGTTTPPSPGNQRLPYAYVYSYPPSRPNALPRNRAAVAQCGPRSDHTQTRDHSPFPLYSVVGAKETNATTTWTFATQATNTAGRESRVYDGERVRKVILVSSSVIYNRFPCCSGAHFLFPLYKFSAVFLLSFGALIAAFLFSFPL